MKVPQNEAKPAPNPSPAHAPSPGAHNGNPSLPKAPFGRMLPKNAKAIAHQILAESMTPATEVAVVSSESPVQSQGHCVGSGVQGLSDHLPSFLVVPPSITQQQVPQDSPAPTHANPQTPTSTNCPQDLLAMAQAVVEHAAVWGDGEQGLARLRLGARARGGLANRTVELTTDGDQVRVRVDGIEDDSLLANWQAKRDESA
jgi:hypothetical protein